MDVELIINEIIKINKTAIINTVQETIFFDVISSFFSLKITFNYFNLCDVYPKLMNKIIKSDSFFDLLLKRIDIFILECISNLQFENVNIINKTNFYDIKIENIIPIILFKIDIKSIYEKVIKSRFIFDKEEIKEKNNLQNSIIKDKISKKICLVIVKGKCYKIKETLVLKSSFFVCENEICTDRNFILRLSSINYLFKNSKKSFIHLVDSNYNICLNCKSRLCEIIKSRLYVKQYDYIISDGVYNIYGQSSIELQNQDFFQGVLERKNNGKLFLKIEKSYDYAVDYFKYKIHNNLFDFNKQFDLTINLLSITNFIFEIIKKNSDLHDCLLLIILNILQNNNSKMLIFTTDTSYVKKCALNLFGIYNKNINISYDIKTLKRKGGLCILNYTDIKISDIDFVFHIPIRHLLDYSYQPSTKKIEIYNRQKELNENDHKNIQNLFIEFRKKYKRLLEPEKLLNTLTNLYISVYEYTEKVEYINKFIIKNYIDKLI